MDPAQIVEGMSSLSICADERFYLHSIGRSGDAHVIRNQDEYHNNVHWTRLVNTVAHQAIEHIRNRNYEQFDALVSECQCHLRAYFVARNVMQMATFSMPEVQEKEVPFRKATLRQLLTEKGLVVEVPEMFLFFVEAHFLTITKRVQQVAKECSEPGCKALCVTTEEVSIIPECLQNGMSSKFMAMRIKQVKESLSVRSVQYFQRACGNPEVLTRNIRVIQSRLELPCAYSFVGTVRLLAKDGIPILVRVQRAEHYVEDVRPIYDVEQLYVPVDGSYTPCPMETIDPQSVSIILEGRRAGSIVHQETASDYKQRLLAHSLDTIVDWNGAQHDQYTQQLRDISHIEHIDDSERARLRALKDEAIRSGCSFENQSLLLFTHMFVGGIHE